ncbi:fumarylacetoacetate hydrolase family protein [Actinomycetospora sp. TBRC 11914]|uniref:fumarylacetoacetate hydrolase family protein n=1 Tax=Actinomycetospora sp. TBRC 11914 TaxID=2729387 RepID=UPI00145D7A19|nr:fumarylacetoacetate hydrolase family protein [Actinomycetospora sp. TBRC 11914]NMO89967.1 fumarylacetoacetate hydrolase family protein [Actinomycetospora sp. TBRC 11914]
MRIAHHAGRLVLLEPGTDPDEPRGIDVAAAGSDADPQTVYEHWDAFRAWAATASFAAAVPLDPAALGPVVPRPPQVFGIGLNYRDHAAESGMDLPTEPVVFTKYPTSVTGPRGDVRLSPGDVDWEVELVAVIGRGGHGIAEADGWDHVAGLTLGQDLSDRVTQFAAPPAQFGLGKSYPGFSPLGPALVTADELRADGLDPDDLELGCLVNGESVQKGRTGAMIFSVPALVARLSAVVTLLPGDVVFTGTPAGIGAGRTPPRFLSEGDELTSWCTGIGQMRHRFVGSR